MFDENHLVNIVHLNAGKRNGTVSCIEPVIDECIQNIKNASVGLGTETLRQPASNSNDHTGAFSATKYKSTFQTDLKKRKFIIQS